MPAALFGIFKNHILAPRPLKMSSDKKVMKTKNLPFDEIYLERGLGFELRPQIGALGPKNSFLAFLPICQIPSCHSLFQVLQGVIFGGMQIKKLSKPIPKNSFRCPEHTKSLMGAIWPFKWGKCRGVDSTPLASPTESKRRLY